MPTPAHARSSLPALAEPGWLRAHGRTVLLITGILALLMLAGAVLVQVLGHEEPCPLCVLQRYACLLVTFLAWGAALVRPRSGAGTVGDRPLAVSAVGRTLRGLALLVALTGLGLAIYHTTVVWHPIVSCGIDTLQPLVNDLPTARWFPILFQAMGMCTNPAPLLGLPLPVWSALGFALLSATLAAVLGSTRGPKGRREACPRCSGVGH